jgi:hypothetical protein
MRQFQGSVFRLGEDVSRRLARYLVEPHNMKYPYTPNDSLEQSVHLVRATFLRGVGLWACYD